MDPFNVNSIIARGPRWQYFKDEPRIRCPYCDKLTPMIISIIENGDKHICSHCYKNIVILLGSMEETKEERG